MKLAPRTLSTLLFVLTVKAAPASPAASCTVTDYNNLAAAVSSCTALTLSGIAVPAGEYLDLTKLKAGSTVTFTGTTVGIAL